MAITHEQRRTLLHAQTAKIHWRELERHFARGAIVKVAAELERVEVAARMVEDDENALAEWLDRGKVVKASADDARDWSTRDPVLWAVVAAPWVLVQERAPG